MRVYRFKGLGFKGCGRTVLLQVYLRSRKVSSMIMGSWLAGLQLRRRGIQRSHVFMGHMSVLPASDSLPHLGLRGLYQAHQRVLLPFHILLSHSRAPFRYVECVCKENQERRVRGD